MITYAEIQYPLVDLNLFSIDIPGNPDRTLLNGKAVQNFTSSVEETMPEYPKGFQPGLWGRMM